MKILLLWMKVSRGIMHSIYLHLWNSKMTLNLDFIWRGKQKKASSSVWICLCFPLIHPGISSWLNMNMSFFFFLQSLQCVPGVVITILGCGLSPLKEKSFSIFEQHNSSVTACYKQITSPLLLAHMWVGEHLTLHWYTEINSPYIDR